MSIRLVGCALVLIAASVSAQEPQTGPEDSARKRMEYFLGGWRIEGTSDQPKVSALVRGRLAGFSLDRLVRFLVLLGRDVEIVVKPRTRAAGQGRVLVA